MCCIVTVGLVDVTETEQTKAREEKNTGEISIKYQWSRDSIVQFCTHTTEIPEREVGSIWGTEKNLKKEWSKLLQNWLKTSTHNQEA